MSRKRAKCAQSWGRVILLECKERNFRPQHTQRKKTTEKMDGKNGHIYMVKIKALGKRFPKSLEVHPSTQSIKKYSFFLTFLYFQPPSMPRLVVGQPHTWGQLSTLGEKNPSHMNCPVISISELEFLGGLCCVVCFIDAFGAFVVLWLAAGGRPGSGGSGRPRTRGCRPGPPGPASRRGPGRPSHRGAPPPARCSAAPRRSWPALLSAVHGTNFGTVWQKKIVIKGLNRTFQYAPW